MKLAIVLVGASMLVLAGVILGLTFYQDQGKTKLRNICYILALSLVGGVCFTEILNNPTQPGRILWVNFLLALMMVVYVTITTSVVYDTFLLQKRKRESELKQSEKSDLCHCDETCPNKKCETCSCKKKVLNK